MATIIAARQNRSHEDFDYMRGAQLSSLHDPLPHQDIIWEGEVEKFAHYGRSAWRRVYMIIGQARQDSQPFELGYNIIVALASSKDSAMIDWIPVNEIRDVLLDGQTGASASGLQQVRSKIWNKSQKGLTASEEQGSGLAQDTDEGSQDENHSAFRILTVTSGHNNGRTYHFRCETEAASHTWSLRWAGV